MKTLAIISWVVAVLLIGFVAGRYRPAEDPRVTGALFVPTSAPGDDLGPTRPVITIDLRDAPLGAVLAEMRKQSDLELELDAAGSRAYGLGVDTVVSLKCDRQPIDTALTGLQAGPRKISLARYGGDDPRVGPVNIAEALRVETRMYDLEPVFKMWSARNNRLGPLFGAADEEKSASTTSNLCFPSPRKKSGPLTQDALTRAEAVDFVASLLQDTVASETWKDNGGAVGSLREWGGLLIVRQNVENHRLIRRVIDQLGAGAFEAVR